MINKTENKAVYIATTEANSGKSIASLGLMQLLLGKVAKVGYFRPIIDDLSPGKTDNHINTVISHFNLNLQFDEAYTFHRSEVIDLLNHNKKDELIRRIIEQYKSLEERFDFILVEGTSFSATASINEFDINVLIAQNLGVPAIILANAQGRTLTQLAAHLHTAHDSFQEKGVEVLAAIANKVPVDDLTEVDKALKQQLPKQVMVSAIPLNPVLANPSVKEIVAELNADILFGGDYINNRAGHFSVGAMQLRNYLPLIKEQELVITPGDRAGVILGVLQANVSANYPPVAGIVLTGGLVPDDSIIKLIEGLSEVVPIISVQTGTFSTANRIGAIKSQIYAENTDKILASINDFEQYVQTDELLHRLITFQSKGITPRMFQYNLLKKAQRVKKHIVLPEGTDPRILMAAKRLIELDVVQLTLLGDRDQIEKQLAMHDIALDLNTVDVINPRQSDRFEDYAETLYQLRKHKNMNQAIAKDRMEGVSYFGTMMVYKGHADGMVSGAAHTTQNTILPAFQFIKTKPDTKLVSSVFFMLLEDRVSVYGDCAINPNPTAEELAEIAISSAATAKAFDIEPKVAMLSYSSGASGVGEDVERVRQATGIVKQKRPDLKVMGPIQYDAAVDIKVGKLKMPESEIAGQANVFIFPDLNTGNNTYKAVQRETKALAIGPILQGLKKPVNDLSRGCTVDDVFNTVVVTAIQAQEDGAQS
ncbi:MAG: phosphate acetyltransferase [Marinicella pacifica]